jgi:quinol monooxygenase YgiN
MTSSPAKITAILTAHPGKIAELGDLLTAMAPHCRAEPGNLRWDIWREPSPGARFVLDELYVDAAAVEAHHATPHYQNYLTRVPALADRTALMLEAVAVG